MDGSDPDPLADVDMSRYGAPASTSAAPPTAAAPTATAPSDPLADVDMSRYGAPASTSAAASPDGYVKVTPKSTWGEDWAAANNNFGQTLKDAALGTVGSLARGYYDPWGEAKQVGHSLISAPGHALESVGSAIQAPFNWAANKVLGPDVGPSQETVDKGLAPYANVADEVLHPVTHFANAPIGTAADIASVAIPATRAAFGRPLLGAAAAAAGAPAIAGPISDAEYGAGVRDAMVGAKRQVDAAYELTRNPNDVFHPNAAPIIENNVKQALAAESQLLQQNGGAQLFPNYDRITAALRGMHNQLYGAAPGRLNMDYLEEVRRGLRELPEGATDNERRLAGAAIKGLDAGTTQALGTPGMFQGADPATTLRNMQNARALHARYAATFGDDAPQPVQSALKALPPDPSTATDLQLHQVGATLGQGMVNQRSGGALYQHLNAATPNVDDYLRNRMLSNKGAQAANNLSLPHAPQVFGSDIDRARALADSKGPNDVWRRYGAPLVKRGIQGALIGAGAHFGDWPGVAAATVADIGLGKLPVLNPTAKTLAERYYGGEAPGAVGRALGTGVRVGNNALIGSRAYNALTNQDTLLDDRQPHARGGKVKPSGHQHLVDRLMRAVETAKKAEQQRTSAILQQPDEHVARALNVAQEAI